MILFPGGGSLFEITISPLGPLVKVVIPSLDLDNSSEIKNKGETKCGLQRGAFSRGFCDVEARC